MFVHVLWTIFFCFSFAWRTLIRFISIDQVVGGALFIFYIFVVRRYVFTGDVLKLSTCSELSRIIDTSIAAAVLRLWVYWALDVQRRRSILMATDTSKAVFSEGSLKNALLSLNNHDSTSVCKTKVFFRSHIKMYNACNRKLRKTINDVKDAQRALRILLSCYHTVFRKLRNLSPQN
jgi:hypothetical protein